MADENRTEENAKYLEIVMLRKMGIDVVLDRDEFNRVLKANEKLQKMELELSELSKLKNELNSLNEEKKTVDENNQRLKEDSVERGKRNFTEFIEAAKAMKEFIPATKEIQSYHTSWYDINKIKVQVDNSASDNASFYDITEGKFIYVSKRDDDSIVCTIKNNTSEAIVYYDENNNFIDEKKKPWYLYENFANSNHISELKTAIKEDLEKRIGTTKKQLDKAHKELHEAEKAVKNKNLLSENQSTEPAEPKKFDNSVSISSDEFLELSRSIDSKDFEKFADRIQAGSAEYWTYLACVQIEEYNTNQLRWILENREVRFDEIKRNDVLTEKVREETNLSMSLPQWAAVSDDPAIIDAVFSKMTEKDFAWAKENGVFNKAEEFYNEKFVENPEERNSSVSFDSLKNWVKQYSPESFSENKPVHYYARQVPPEEQYYDIDEELSELEVSIIETYTGSRYSEIINNDIPNGSMSKFADTMNEISDDFDTFFQNGGKPSEQDLEDGIAQYASLEEAVNTELPKKDGSKYTEEEMKEWRNVFERYSKAGDMGHYWSSTNATHEVLTQVMELQTGEPFVLASLKGSSQGEDVTAVIPEKLYTKEFVEDIEAKYWNEGVEYLVFEDDSGKVRNLEDLQEHDVFENNSVSFYLPSYKSVEELAVALGAKKGELTVYDFEGYKKTPKYEKVQYMKTLTNPLDDLRTVLKAYDKGFDSEYKLDDYDENRVTKGKWSIATGGYDQAWELYYDNTPVASCDTDNILTGNGQDFNGFTEADMLRVVTQEYRNVKCPEIVPPTVEDYEQYLNDYFQDGSFSLEPENAFDEYPFEGLLNKNLERHYHYEKDSVGGVILSYDDSNHTEYLQPGDDANSFLSEVENIENGVIQVNAEEQLDNLINNYFPDFFPDDFRDEDTKNFITQQEIIEAVNNYECGKLYREYDPEGFEKDAQEWIEDHSPAFTNVSELPQFMKAIPFAKCELKKIENWQVEEAKECGLNLEGYKHEITTDFIAHVVKNHGNVITEAQRGNVAVTEKDLASLNDVITSPDRVVYGVTNKVFVAGQIIERPSIIYAKNMPDGTSLYFEEVLDGNKNNSMRGKTFWKKANRISDESLLNIIGSNKSVTNIDNAKIKVHEDGDQIHHSSSTETVDAEVNSAAREPNENITQFVKKSIADYTAAKTNAEGQISNGQVLGFVKDNKIFINIDSFNAETPIHEYTHLWDKTVQKKNPELWKQGVELLKKTDTWKEIERNPAYADIAGDEDLLASEVHARLAGKEGAELFRNISEEVRKNVGTVLYDLRKELAEEFCSDRINDVQPFRDDLKRIHDTNFAGINFEVSAKEWTPIRIQQQCEEICNKLGLEYMDATSNFPREDGTVLSNDTYFVNLSVSGFRNLPLQHVITSDEIKLAAYKWNEDSWNYIRDNFTEWKEGNLKSVKELSVNDFVNITIKDFVDGKNPVPHITENIRQENIQMQYERKTHNEYTLISNYGYGWEEETAWDNYKDAKQGLKEYRENGGGSYYLKHHTRVPNGFTVDDGHYVPEEDITPKNFKDYFKSSLKLRQIAGNPQKAAAYCFKHANSPSVIQKWLEKQGCTSKEKTDKLFESWVKETVKPEQSKANAKVKNKSKEDESWSISD